ncbi:hypothetical protein SPW_7352 [Streptomyces sp. W007]|uniref:hypothetical protein n=1 Tax=Streptomyces sp. W007 TaxID=1055352 RepID=UPI000241A787|nr:hypothetical protein [Streptomyces sp. W007]EHM24258.1 hypothetical protein SPW_7352 [Streptomyces sp. W007]
MSERQFKDCDGDTWTEWRPGMLRLTERVRGTIAEGHCTASIEDVRDLHGPLTEVRPDVDVRALLADVLEELADGVLEDYWSATDPVSERIYGRLARRIRGRELKLREESA